MNREWVVDLWQLNSGAGDPGSRPGWQLIILNDSRENWIRRDPLQGRGWQQSFITAFCLSLTWTLKIERWILNIFRPLLLTSYFNSTLDIPCLPAALRNCSLFEMLRCWPKIKKPFSKTERLLRNTAATYSPAFWCSTIGHEGLNFSVRYGKRWTPSAKPP